MTSRQLIARKALRAALETRRLGQESKEDPICVYDVAERLGVEVKFCLGSSLGGMYSKASKTVLVPTLRPLGRQAFTCAHELGHWYFGHGSHIDSLDMIDPDYDSDPDEQLANTFAGYLLMTPWSIESAFNARNWSPKKLNAQQAYCLASQFSVGYETFVQHLRYSLDLITDGGATQLLRSTPKLLRQDILGQNASRHMVLVDRHWRKLAIDLQVGDVAVIEQDVQLNGSCAAISGRCPSGTIIAAVTPGIATAHGVDGEWAATIRIRRRDFEGRSIYRHLEDPDVDSPT